MKYKQWNRAASAPQARAAMEAAGVPPLAALTLCARGLDTPEKASAFLDAGRGQLLDPFLMKDMDRAAARVRRALAAGEHIAVYGDYDVDGITSTCLLTDFLRREGGTVIPYIPDRMEEGYGLNREAIDSAFSRSDSTYLVRFYDKLTSMTFGEGLYRETIADSKEWEASPKAGFKEMAYYMAGLSYSRLQMRDSADYYLRLAVDSSLAKDIKWYAHHFARNYADFLYDFNPKASISYLRLLKERYPEREILGSYVMPWINLGELDSARKYIEKNTLDLERSHSDDIASHALNYAYQFILDVKENKPVDISRLGQYCDSLYIVKSQTEKAERERLIDQNRLRQANLRLEMSRQRTFSILVIVSLFSLLVAGGVSIYIRNRRNRLIDMEERLEALRQLLDESRQSVAEEEKPDSAFFRKVLLQQLGVIRLMATTPTQQNKELLQQMTRITNEDVPVDTLLVWDDLYPIIDAVYDNFHTHLVRLSDGRLLEKEIQLCCLLCAGFSTKEISVVTQQSVRTIYQRKTDIRHKLGMDEKEDIIGNISAQTANINFSL